MDGVDIVTLHDIVDDLADEITVLLISRVEKNLPVVTEEAVGVFVGIVIRRKDFLCRGRDAVRIQPCVKFETALVRLFDGIFHGVPHRLRSPATLAGEPSTPRFEFRLVYGVGGRPHLKDHGVAAGIGKTVHLVADICLCLFCRFILPL